MYVRIIYDNGYCGCKESEIIEVENIEEADQLAIESLYSYADSYSYLCSDEDNIEEYYENCTYSLEEISKEEYEEEIY